MPSRITRRDAAIRLVSQSALLWGIPVSLFAQSEQDSELREAINTAITEGTVFRSRIVDGVVPVSAWIGQEVENERASRLNLAQAFEDASPQDVTEYVRDGFHPVYTFVVQADVPPIPSVADVQNSPINTVCRNATEEQVPAWKILGDIVFEALGVTVDGDVFSQFLENNPDARRYFEQVTSAISTQQWSKAADLIDELLWWLVVGGGARNLVNFLWENSRGGGGFLYRIGWRISLRFVPIVGWLYLGGTIVLAIKANLHRFSGDSNHNSCSH